MSKLALLSGVVAVTIWSSAAVGETLTWNLQSDDPHSVMVEFYSQDRNASWPGDGKAYSIADYDPHSFTLQCRSGETICMGAWVEGREDEYWGVGMDDRHGCTQCCHVCDGAEIPLQVLNP